MGLRRISAVAVLIAALALWPGAAAGDEAQTTLTTQAAPTTRSLPRTALEAEQRDDGGSSPLWWIGSGVAALAAVAIGGTVLARRNLERPRG